MGMVARLATGIVGFNDQKYHLKIERRSVYTMEEAFIVKPNNHREFTVKIPQSLSIDCVVPTSCNWPENIHVEHMIEVIRLFEICHPSGLFS